MTNPQNAINAYLHGSGRLSPSADPVRSRIDAQAPMVRRIALHLADRLDRMVDVDDLIQSGFIGLMEAAQRYDPSTGVPFDAFALTRVRGAMVDELRRNDWCPRSLRQQGKSIRQARQALEQSLGRTPRSREVADYLQLPADHIQQAETRLEATNQLSLDTLFEDRGDQWDDLGSDDANPLGPLLKQAGVQELSQALQQLPEREQMIIHLYYQEEMNLKEIAHILELTEARICQLRKKALKALNSTLSDDQSQF